MKVLCMKFFDPATIDKKDFAVQKAKGCPKCHGTGYKGRVGIFEWMPVTGELEELVLQGRM